MTALRKLATGVAVFVFLLFLSATPAEARPVVDSPVYCGPVSLCAAAEATAAARGLLPWLAR